MNKVQIGDGYTIVKNEHYHIITPCDEVDLPSDVFWWMIARYSQELTFEGNFTWTENSYTGDAYE